MRTKCSQHIDSLLKKNRASMPNVDLKEKDRLVELEEYLIYIQCSAGEAVLTEQQFDQVQHLVKAAVWGRIGLKESSEQDIAVLTAPVVSFVLQCGTFDLAERTLQVSKIF